MKLRGLANGLVVHVPLRGLQPDSDSETAGAERVNQQRTQFVCETDIGDRSEVPTTKLSLSVRRRNDPQAA